MTASLLLQLAELFPARGLLTADVITVLVDAQRIGKEMALIEGKVEKQSRVVVGNAEACQYHIPTLGALQQLLTAVSSSPYAAIANCGWSPVPVGVPFRFTSQDELRKQGLNPEGVYEVDGVKVFARLKLHATVSSYQLLDRDVDEHTPETFKALNYDAWCVAMNALLPGFSDTSRLRAMSSSARVLLNDRPVGGGNGHTWVKVADPSDVDRTRTALLARAAVTDRLWLKPKFSSTTGLKVGDANTTICDPSVWNPGRLVFVGAPTVHSPLTLTDQGFHLYPGAATLDTSKAEINPVATLRKTASTKPMLVSGDGKAQHLQENTLTLKTPLELADGTTITVAEAMARGVKLRCQAPFRDSVSMAAFFALDENGNPFVHDSGTGTTYRLKMPDARGDARTIILKMQKRLEAVLQLDDDLAPHCINADVIIRATERTFWQKSNSKILALMDHDGFNEFTAVNAQQFGLRNLFGDCLNRTLLEALVGADAKQLTEVQCVELMTSQYKLFVEHVVSHRQASGAAMSVDMFATQSVLDFTDGQITATLRHRPFNEYPMIPVSIVAAVWADYTEHFPQFPALVDAMLYARFCASTRRRAFVWLHAMSDFGKSKLVASFMKLGLVFVVGSKEMNKAMAGDPSGISPHAALRAWMMFIDEWKAVSAELKMLNDTISITPKNQMRVEVPLYLKLFASAEDVGSLTGDGVEQQFVERFSYLNPPPAKIDDRPMHRAMGASAYSDALTAGIAQRLNQGVTYMLGLGRLEADRVAMASLEAFHNDHLLTNSFSSLTETLDQLADQVRDMVRLWASEQYLPVHLKTTPRRLQEALAACTKGTVSGRPVVQLTGAVVPLFLELVLSKKTSAKVGYKEAEITKKVDEGGTKVQQYRITPGSQTQTRGAVVFIDVPKVTVPGFVPVVVSDDLELPEWLRVA